MTKVRISFGASLLLLVGAASCNAILGMEELDPMPLTGAGGDTSVGGGGGEAGQGGMAKLSKGLDCTDGEQCQSGYCVDDVCCEAESCSGECTACNVSGKLGSCASVSLGTPCGGATQEPTCNPDYCDGAGSCADAAAANGNPCSENNGNVCCQQQCSGSCITTAPVEGGTFFRSYDDVTYKDQSSPAKISSFSLDLYEVSVGRFRAFVDAGKGTQLSPPMADAGAHPKISGSGWNSLWDFKLEADTAKLKKELHCNADYETWTDTVGQNESRPINCVTWYEAAAFCHWDGGRLPTEAEWNYAAAGGDQQRVYPWSSPPNSTTIDPNHVIYDCLGDGIAECTGVVDIGQVGSRSPQGDARWGHSDLSGNVREWVLDFDGPYPNPCEDCANLTGTVRSSRGGGFMTDNSEQYVARRVPGSDPSKRSEGVGIRCAREP